MKDIIRIYGLLGLPFLLLLGMGVSNVPSFLDIPSLQIVLGGTLCGIMLIYGSKLKNINEVLLKPLDYCQKNDYRNYIRMMEHGSRFSIGLGAIGTLIGLILMFGNISDVESIGPNLAVAMITTLYGVIISEVVFQPLKQYLVNYLPENVNDYHELTQRENKNWVLLTVGVLLPVLVAVLFMYNMEKINADSALYLNHYITTAEVKNLTVQYKGQLVVENERDRWDAIRDGNNFTSFFSEEGNVHFYYNLEKELNPNELLLRFRIDKEIAGQYYNERAYFEYPVKYNEDQRICFQNSDWYIVMDFNIENRDKKRPFPTDTAGNGTGITVSQR